MLLIKPCGRPQMKGQFPSAARWQRMLTHARVLYPQPTNSLKGFMQRSSDGYENLSSARFPVPLSPLIEPTLASQSSSMTNPNQYSLPWQSLGLHAIPLETSASDLKFTLLNAISVAFGFVFLHLAFAPSTSGISFSDWRLRGLLWHEYEQTVTLYQN